MKFSDLNVAVGGESRKALAAFTNVRVALATVPPTVEAKEAALGMGYEPNYWSRIKSGEKQAHLERIARLPEPTQREFLKRWGRQLKLDIRDTDTQRAALTDLAEAAVKALKAIG